MHRENRFLLNIWAFLKLLPVLLKVLLVCLIVKECASNPYDLDNGVKSREIYSSFVVADSCSNGFEITYSTKEPVTKERLNEMYDRKYIYANIDSMRKAALLHFGEMLYVNIYDFRDFILPYYIDSNLIMEYISVYGQEKNNLYIGKNPKIPDSARWYNPTTAQGRQYIIRVDIYNPSINERVYRYKGCSILFSTSSTDERFSHFSEDERVY